MPRPGLGDPAADQRTDRGRQHGHDAGQRRRHALLAEGKQQEHGGEDRRDQHAAGEALHHARDDEGLEAAAGRAGGRGDGEQAERADEQPAQAEHARQQAGQRDRDHLGDEIGRLHPAHLVGRDGQRLADLGQRRDHDLDVEHGHEHAERHGREADPGAGARSSLVRHCRSAASSARMRTHSTSAFSTENTMPYHTRPKQSGSTRISAATMAVVGMRHEAVRPLSHQRRAGQHDDARRPARPKSGDHPDAQSLQDDEHRQPAPAHADVRLRRPPDTKDRRATRHARPRSADSGRAPPRAHLGQAGARCCAGTGRARRDAAGSPGRGWPPPATITPPGPATGSCR